MDAERLLHRVREGRVSDVVKQSSSARGDSIFCIDLVSVTEAIENARHQMRCAEAVGEARVLGSLVRVETQPQLLDSSQPLKLWRVDQPNHQLTLGVIAQRNDVMNRVAVDTLGQFRSNYRGMDAAV